MSWLRIEGRMPHHRKVAPLSDAAFRLHVTAQCWCVEERSDGRIPAAVPPTLQSAPRGKQLERAISELVSAGLWDLTADGFAVHDYLDYNPSADELAALRAARVAAGQIGGLQKASKRLASASPPAKQTPSNGLANSKQTGWQNSSPIPVPIPIPDQDPRISRAAREAPTAAVAARPKKARRFPDFEPKPEHVNLAIQLGADLAGEAAKFRDHEFRDAKSDPDACFRTWLRRSIELKRTAISQRQSNRAGDGLEAQLARVRRLEAEEAQGLAPAEPDGFWAALLPAKAQP